MIIMMHHYEPISGGSVYSCNDHALEIVGVKTIKLNMYDGTIKVFRDMRHVKGLKKNLLSYGLLDNNARKIETWKGIMKVFRGALVVMKGEKIAINLYMLKGETLLEAEASVASCSSDSAMLCHQKLGHIKQYRLKFNTSNSRGKSVLELVYSDVWQAPVTSLGGAKYFVSFIDDYSRRCWVYPIKKKSDVFSTFKNFKARVEPDSGNKIKCFRTDNGGEYTSEEFDDFYKKEGIKRQFTVANTPQQNRVAEQMNRTFSINCNKLKTPMETWTGKPANYSNLHVFGSIVYVMYNSQEISKLDPKSRKCKFLEYAYGVKGYCLWDPTACKVIISRDVIFVENKLQRKEDDDSVEKKPIGNKWVFKIKRNGDDQVERYRARLVVKGYAQKECIDFNEIFSHVVRLTTVRVVLTMCATLNLHLEQLDVKTTFLYGNLEEEICMLQLEGFEENEKKNLVCRLNKSLYGLKQASRCWYKRFDSFIMCLGYNRLNADPCAYFKRSGDNDLVILLLYVDDMLVAGPNKDHIEDLKVKLAREFEMKDFGSANKILGMQIYRDRTNRKIWLSQKNYLKKILSRFNMQDCKPISTPLPINFKLSSSMSPGSEEERMEMSRVPYASTVGSLMFVMICTRPDIAQAVGVVSRYMANPGKEHWNTIKRIMRYIKGTSNVALYYEGSNLLINGYVDSDYTGDLDKSKSTTGYVFKVAGGAVSWVSKLQSVVATSTIEAEYVAATQANKEAIWLKLLLEELGHNQEYVSLFCDSQSALHLTRNQTFHSKTKRIRVQYHFIRKNVEEGTVDIQKIHTKYNIADFMTKAINADKFTWCRSSCGLSETHSQGIPLVNWSTISQPRAHGGLDRRALSSHLWRALSNVWPMFYGFLSWSIGDGASARFWHDVWVPNLGPLTSHKDPNVTVNDNFLVCEALSTNASHLGLDRLCWADGQNETFFVKSAYRRISSSDWNPKNPTWSSFWKPRVPERIRYFTWLAYRDRLLTNVNRCKRNIASSPLCDIYGTSDETTLHILRDCTEARKLWMSIIPPNAANRFFTLSLEHWLLDNISLNHLLHGTTIPWKIAFVSLAWQLWKRRNSCIFNGEGPSNANLKREANSVAHNLAKFASRSDWVVYGNSD
ncbi:Retrovirus-related Pol polyprotein from transposon TNT 1-94 [Hibiscus syriacus]|uniref:Retrovirus-related Pol polyprotein from transposon TNT 1-94 n=1 Tax=Hibiscus syriacus TaxID=106335 RepID=A0A6A2XC82_HIBSY|nr:Retrovirus-related Pol polyprotein from transposon TNT 1-94 [Hibiscus syriacus]